MANQSTRDKVIARLALNHGMSLTRLQKRYPAVYRQVWELRVELEEAVKNTFGAINLEQASVINVACRMEMYAKVCEYHLNKGHIEGKDVMKHLLAASEFTVRRNTQIHRLHLTGVKDRDESVDDWEEVDAMLGAEMAGGAEVDETEPTEPEAEDHP